MAIQKCLTLFCQLPVTNCVQLLICWSLRTMAVASSIFSSLVDVEGILSILHHSHLSTPIQHFLSTCMEFSEMEYWPHTEHMNVCVCGFQHLANLLPIKKVSHISVLPCCKLKIAQPHSLHNSNSHTESKDKTVTVLTLHVNNHSVVSSQTLALYQWQPGKKEEEEEAWELSEGPS